MAKFIDLNCDMGESFGRYALGNDAAVMPFITSANLACGFHAGDPQVMQAKLDDPVKAVDLAMVTGLVLGAPEFQRR